MPPTQNSPQNMYPFRTQYYLDTLANFSCLTGMLDPDLPSFTEHRLHDETG